MEALYTQLELGEVQDVGQQRLQVFTGTHCGLQIRPLFGAELSSKPFKHKLQVAEQHIKGSPEFVAHERDKFRLGPAGPLEFPARIDDDVGHLVKSVGQLTQFIRTLDGRAYGQVALPKAVERLRGGRKRPYDHAGEHPGDHHSHEADPQTSQADPKQLALNLIVQVTQGDP